MATKFDGVNDRKDESLGGGDQKRMIISELPREKGWLAEHLYQYQQYWYHPDALEGVLHAHQHFKGKTSDVLLVSHPKAGTTWLKALVFAIMNRKNNINNNDLLTSSPHECIPFLELPQHDHHHYRLFDDSNVEPRLLATHIPVTCLPVSVLTSGCKVVYICRDPKDVLVSSWHFTCKLRTRLQQHNPETKPPLSFEEAYELFCRGASFYGPYWDHVLGYWKASLEQPKRVLFLKYEDIKREPLVYVKKLAQFLDHPFTLEVQAKEVVDLCSFETLSNLQVNKDGVFHESGVPVKNDVFYRRGNVGDWRNHLTPEMASRLDQITRHKLDGSGLVLT